jgi:PGF-pre-PGF domain-containing protein
MDGKASVTFSKISSGKTGTVIIPETAEIPFEELAIKVKNTVVNTKVEVYKLSEKPSSMSEISTGVTHTYIQIDETNIVAADIDSVTIKFKVPVSWINDKNIDKATVVLNRYADGKWNALTTAKDSEDSSYVHFSAASPGLSTFGISGEKKSVEMPSFPMVTTVPPTKAPVTTMPPTSAAQTLAPPLTEEPGTPIMMIALAILAIVIIASVAYYKLVMDRGEDKGETEKEQKESGEIVIRPVAEEPKE